MTEVELKKTKQILIPNKYPTRFFAIDFFANLYEGSHPTYQFYGSLSDPYQSFQPGDIIPKENGLEVIQKELLFVSQKNLIGFYQNPDPYNDSEKETLSMKRALEVIRVTDLGVFIETTSDLILRDLSILQEIAQKSPVVIAIPIGNTIDTIQERFEGKGYVNYHNRIKLLHKLKDAGLVAGVIMKPMIPYVNDTPENILQIVEDVSLAGGDFIYPSFVLALDESQRNAFYHLLDEYFPGLKNVFTDKYGSKKTWTSAKLASLKKEFVFECKKRKIAFGMKDITNLYKPSSTEQFRLF